MHQLNSKNYTTVQVITKDETIIMPGDKGSALMHYLTQETAGSHIMVTDIKGNQIVINKFDIKKVAPVIGASSKYKTATELGMPEL